MKTLFISLILFGSLAHADTSIKSQQLKNGLAAYLMAEQIESKSYDGTTKDQIDCAFRKQDLEDGTIDLAISSGAGMRLTRVDVKSEDANLTETQIDEVVTSIYEFPSQDKIFLIKKNHILISVALQSKGKLEYCNLEIGISKITGF